MMSTKNYIRILIAISIISYKINKHPYFTANNVLQGNQNNITIGETLKHDESSLSKTIKAKQGDLIIIAGNFEEVYLADSKGNNFSVNHQNVDGIHIEFRVTKGFPKGEYRIIMKNRNGEKTIEKLILE